MGMFDKTGADLGASAKDNIDAFSQSAEQWKGGFMQFSKSVFASAKGHVDRSKSAFDSMRSARSLREVIDVQKDYVKSGAESVLTDAAKITSDCMQASKDVVAPLAAQFKRAARTGKE